MNFHPGIKFSQTGYFFKKVGNFVADDFERLRNDEATIIGTAIVADFRALANMTPEQLAAHLGHEASSAFLFFIGGGVLHAGGRAATHAMDTAFNVGKKFVANHTFHMPITFQYQGSRLCSGFPIDAVKLKKPVKGKKAKNPITGEADIVQAEYLHRSLELREIFTADGKLTAKVLAEAEEIMNLSKFTQASPIYKELLAKGNIEQWGKYSYYFELNMQHIHNGKLVPLRGEVHFYMNKLTKEVFYGRDYKVKLRLPGQPTITIDELLTEAFEGVKLKL